MNTKNITWIAVSILIIGGFLIWQQKEPAELPTVRLGLQTQPMIGLVKIAIEEKFFEKEGLNVEVKEFTAGKLALQALIGGSLDLVTPAEFPVTLATLNGEELSILAEVNKTVGGFPMILRRDKEVFVPQEYFAKKKKIATAVGGGPEFFTADFFKKYDIKSSQYEIVSMKPEDMPIALSRGDIDGVAIFEPFSQFAIEKAGENKVFVIKNDDLYSETIVLAGKTVWISQNREIVEKFLRVLKKSETFIKNNPEKAMTIMSAFTKLDEDTLKSLWPNFTLQLGLDTKLLFTMERQAQWAKDTGKVTKETAIPNFRDIIFEEPLKKISPSSVEL